MTLSEPQKREYLSEMGIEPWYPRVSLINAPAATLFAEVPQNDVTVAESSLAQPEPQPVNAAEVTSPPASLEAPVSSTASTEVAPAAPATEAVRAPAEAAVRFELGLYVMGDWLIASTLPKQVTQAQHESGFALLQAILSTMTESLPPLDHDHVISWPFFANPNAKQGAGAARDYVSSMVEQLVEKYGCRRILAFGGVLPRLHEWTSAEGEAFGLPHLVLPSLYKMLQDPQQKARAWALIRQSAFYG